MKKLNLFTKTFKKNLYKGLDPAILAEDVGYLKGIVSLRGVDVNTGKIICNQEFHNTIVNQSKSSIIRLLAQGQSQYKGMIDPTKFRISKMRFSNDTGLGVRGAPAPNKLEYYSISEPSSRVSWGKVHEASGSVAAGGYFGKLSCPEDYLTPPAKDSDKYNISKTILNSASSGGYTPVPSGKVVDVKSAASLSDSLVAINVRPPSHGTLNVKFYKQGSLIEEHFYDRIPETLNAAVYTKDTFKNRPHTIKNYLVTGNANAALNGYFYHVCTPMDASTTISHNVEMTERTTLIAEAGVNTTGTRLYFDYTSGAQGWKVFLQEIALTTPPVKYTTTRIASGDNPSSGNYVWDEMVITFEIGKHNVVNLTIPKANGYYNRGIGADNVFRFLNTEGDAYSVLTPIYYDCTDNYIDDYAVMFTTSMNANQGNGHGGGAGSVLQYTKAFLFTENDDMFSSIQFPSDDFLKNANSTFTISWKILAPVE